MAYFIDTNSDNQIFTNLNEKYPHICFPSVIDENTLLPDGIYLATIDVVEDIPNMKKSLSTIPVFKNDKWYIPINYSEYDESELEYIKQKEYLKHKTERNDKIRNLVVTYNDMEFQASPDAISAMLKYVTIFDDGETINWKLLDNTIATITKADLQQVLKIAHTEISKLKQE